MKNIKIFFLVFIIMIAILLPLAFYSFQNIIRTEASSLCMNSFYKFCEENKVPIFSINKIVYFSTGSGSTNINPNSSFTISDLYQYTDIAIFINNNSDGHYTEKNTLKKVSLSNIEFYSKPSIGTPKLYYKNINDFATNKFDENNLIEKNLNFSTTGEEQIDFSKPILYNNTANPITLSYVNSNIKSNYTLQNTISNINYDRKFIKTL